MHKIVYLSCNFADSKLFKIRPGNIRSFVSFIDLKTTEIGLRQFLKEK